MPVNLPTRVTSKVRHIFVEFAARDGINRNHAAQEVDQFLSVNGFARTRESYLTVRRIGSQLRLNDRAARGRLYDTFANAINHATFEEH